MTPPALTTQRLLLRPYALADEHFFTALFAHSEVMAHVGGSLSSARAAGLFAAIVGRAQPSARVVSAWCVEDARGPAGHAALLRPEEAVGEGLEVGFLLLPDRWGRGYATEIARALAAHARDRGGAGDVLATVDEDHAASRRVLEKAGFLLWRRVQDHEGEFLVYRRVPA